MILKRKTANGESRYLARVFRGRDPVTRKKSYSFQTFTTKRQAERWEREQQHRLDSGTFVEPTRESVGAFLTGWLDSRTAVKPQTLSNYRKLLTTYVLSTDLATVPLGRLSTKTLEAFYRSLSERPLSPRTVRYVHTIMSASFQTGVRDRVLASNPARGAELPRQQRREMHALDRDQLARLLAASEATENRHHALWSLLATGGLRPSEALRLRWRDVGRDQVTVRGETKTQGSRRTVTLSERTMETLQWHRTRQEAEKITAGASYQDRQFVFASETGGPLDLKNATARHFKPLLTAYYQLPSIRVYDLRHSHISHLLAAGVPVHVVAKRVGHASAKMTLDVYGHVLAGQDGDAVAKLAAYYGAAAA